MLGNNIKKLMQNNKITSKELASITNVTPTHISYILNNKREPSIDLLQKIADALNVSVNDFFDDEFIKKENSKRCSEKELPIIPKEFTVPNKAREYINKHQIFGSNGFDSNKLDNKEILEFANELLKQMELISFKFKK